VKLLWIINIFHKFIDLQATAANCFCNKGDSLRESTFNKKVKKIDFTELTTLKIAFVHI